MWAKFEGLAEATGGRDEFGRECGILEQLCFRRRRKTCAFTGDEISVQLGTNSLHYVLARTGTCHDHEASFVRIVRPVLGPWKLI
jgi:hypothetical protein